MSKIKILNKLQKVWAKYPNESLCSLVTKLSGRRGTPCIRCLYGDTGIKDVSARETSVGIADVSDDHIEEVLNELLK